MFRIYYKQQRKKSVHCFGREFGKLTQIFIKKKELTSVEHRSFFKRVECKKKTKNMEMV